MAVRLAGLDPRRLTVLGYVGVGFATALLPLSAGPIGLAASTAALGIGLPFFFGAIANVGLTGFVTAALPESSLGRVVVSLQLLTGTAQIIGSLLGGALAEQTSTRSSLACRSPFVDQSARPPTGDESGPPGPHGAAGRYRRATCGAAVTVGARRAVSWFTWAVRADDAEILHGRQVPDPYRWLEDADSERVRRWTIRQTSHTDMHLSALQQRGWFADRVAHLTEPEVNSVPERYGRRLFFLGRRRGHDVPVLLVSDGAERILLDPAELDGDRTCVIDGWHPAPDRPIDRLPGLPRW